MIITFKNNNKKNPDRLHDFLIQNNCKPIYLKHNTIYDEEGEREEYATEIYIEIEESEQERLINLVNQFMDG